MVHDAQARDPLRALPEVEVRDEQAGRAAVLAGQWLALVFPDDPGLAAGQVLERGVRRVAAVGEGHHVGRRRVEARGLEQLVDGDARERRVELRPLRHAMYVPGDGL